MFGLILYKLMLNELIENITTQNYVYYMNQQLREEVPHCVQLLSMFR